MFTNFTTLDDKIQFPCQNQTVLTKVMSGSLRPYFWIRRNADTYVPLIPVDELPPSVGLRGISVTKNWEDVCQAEMRFLGDHFDHSGQHYVVDLLNPTNNVSIPPPTVFRAPDKTNVRSNGMHVAGGIGNGNADQIQVSPYIVY